MQRMNSLPQDLLTVADTSHTAHHETPKCQSSDKGSRFMLHALVSCGQGHSKPLGQTQSHRQGLLLPVLLLHHVIRIISLKQVILGRCFFTIELTYSCNIRIVIIYSYKL